MRKSLNAASWFFLGMTSTSIFLQLTIFKKVGCQSIFWFSMNALYLLCEKWLIKKGLI